MRQVAVVSRMVSSDLLLLHLLVLTHPFDEVWHLLVNLQRSESSAFDLKLRARCCHLSRHRRQFEVLQVSFFEDEFTSSDTPCDLKRRH